MLLASITIAAYVWSLWEYGEGPHARTIALLALVGVQLGHLFNCRSRTRSAFDGLFQSPFIFAAAATVILLQAMALYVSPLARILDAVPPNISDFLVMLGCVVTPVLVVEITKKFRKMEPRLMDIVT
jgi:magnesium-transporting ATPase (P-type)